MTKTRMGRPPKNPEDRKGGIVAFRADESERSELDQAASAAGMKLSDWIRDRLSAVAKRELRKASRSS